MSDAPLSDRLAAHAAEILADPPDDGTGRGAMPNKAWVPHLRRAGWPVRTEEVAQRAKGDRGPVEWRPVTVVPETWLRLLADRVGREWGGPGGACRGTVD